jgi:hypothetical protein
MTVASNRPGTLLYQREKIMTPITANKRAKGKPVDPAIGARELPSGQMIGRDRNGITVNRKLITALSFPDSWLIVSYPDCYPYNYTVPA